MLHDTHPGERATRPSEKQSHTILFPDDLIEQLRPHAERRGIHPNRLARDIVAAVVDENLVDAVLDDGDDNAV